jgi:putative transposase
MDYIHYNPVKHGWVASPGDWPHSSFAHHLARGVYTRDWLIGSEVEIKGDT